MCHAASIKKENKKAHLEPVAIADGSVLPNEKTETSSLAVNGSSTGSGGERVKLVGCTIKCKFMHPFGQDSMFNASECAFDCPPQGGELSNGGAHVHQRGAIEFNDLHSSLTNNDNARLIPSARQ